MHLRMQCCTMYVQVHVFMTSLQSKGLYWPGCARRCTTTLNLATTQLPWRLLLWSWPTSEQAVAAGPAWTAMTAANRHACLRMHLPACCCCIQVYLASGQFALCPNYLHQLFVIHTLFVHVPCNQPMSYLLTCWAAACCVGMLGIRMQFGCLDVCLWPRFAQDNLKISANTWEQASCQPVVMYRGGKEVGRIPVSLRRWKSGVTSATTTPR